MQGEDISRVATYLFHLSLEWSRGHIWPPPGPKPLRRHYGRRVLTTGHMRGIHLKSHSAGPRVDPPHTVHGIQAVTRSNDMRTSSKTDLIAASIDDKHSAGPSFRPICTGCWFTMTMGYTRVVIFIDSKRLSYILVRMRSSCEDLRKLASGTFWAQNNDLHNVPQPLYINAQWFRSGLACEAHRLSYHSA